MRIAVVGSEYSVGEEIAHAVSHGFGLLLAVAGLVVLEVFAALHGGAARIVSAAVFGSALILLYLASTLYHASQRPRVKDILRRLDHSAIYLLIAGTYTPFALVNLRGPWGWTLFGLVWGLGLIGVLRELLTRSSCQTLELALYLGLGWLALVAIKPLAHALPTPGLLLLVIGGLAYSVGVVFYVWRRLPYHHAIWHVFVLAGSACHFFAVLFYTVLRPA
ncbi:MAG: hemolysin III [Chromatiales bacterium 21-64-14]|nr:MAG: hemolysin III [Chromatiales bacterium 21-64-14]HQU14631.1 hemolysin III family protein [Gammaproteobacteria bacterium]